MQTDKSPKNTRSQVSEGEEQGATLVADMVADTVADTMAGKHYAF